MQECQEFWPLSAVPCKRQELEGVKRDGHVPDAGGLAARVEAQVHQRRGQRPEGGGADVADEEVAGRRAAEPNVGRLVLGRRPPLATK